MKAILLIPLCLFSFKNTVGQDSIYKGKAIYQLSTQANGKPANFPVAFFFQTDQYTQYYITPKRSDDRLLQEIEKRKTENIHDTSTYNELANSLKLSSDDIQDQPLFGSLKNNFIISRWLEPYTKTGYCILDSISPVVWQLVDDTMTISGLKCQKAVGKSRAGIYEAWFTPSIPVAVAPFQFRGLPGLLVEVLNTTTRNHLRLVELTWPYKEAFPVSNCEIRSAISKERRDQIFYQEDAKARKKGEEIRKNFEQKKTTNRD